MARRGPRYRFLVTRHFFVCSRRHPINTRDLRPRNQYTWGRCSLSCRGRRRVVPQWASSGGLWAQAYRRRCPGASSGVPTDAAQSERSRVTGTVTSSCERVARRPRAARGAAASRARRDWSHDSRSSPISSARRHLSQLRCSSCRRRARTRVLRLTADPFPRARTKS